MGQYAHDPGHVSTLHLWAWAYWKLLHLQGCGAGPWVPSFPLASVPFSPFTYPRELTKVCKVPWHIQGWAGFLDISVINANTPLAWSLCALLSSWSSSSTFLPSFLFLEVRSKSPSALLHTFLQNPSQDEQCSRSFSREKYFPAAFFPGC